MTVNWAIRLSMNAMAAGLLNAALGSLGNSEPPAIARPQPAVLVVGTMKPPACAWDVPNSPPTIRAQSNGNGFLANRQEISFLLFKVSPLVDC